MGPDASSNAYLATQSQNGQMSKEDKVKLDALVPSGPQSLQAAYDGGKNITLGDDDEPVKLIAPDAAAASTEMLVVERGFGNPAATLYVEPTLVALRTPQENTEAEVPATSIHLETGTNDGGSLPGADLKLHAPHGAVAAFLEAMGLYFENDPLGYGNPVIHCKNPDHFLTLTANGVGAVWKGTGISAYQGATPGFEEVWLTVADVPELNVRPGRSGPAGYLCGPDSPALAIASNTIVPTKLVSRVAAGLVKTITPPHAAQSGMFGFIAPVGTVVTYDATANIAAAGTLAQGRINWFWWDVPTLKWYPST